MQYNVYVQDKKYRVLDLPTGGYSPTAVYDEINEAIDQGLLQIDFTKPLKVEIRPAGTDLFE